MEIIVAIATAIGSILIGFFVYSRERGNATNFYFALMMLLVGGYAIFNYLTLHSGTQGETFFWSKLILCVSIGIGPVLLFFVRTFPERDFIFNAKIQFIIIGWASANLVAVFFNAVFTSVAVEDGSLIIEYGPLLPSFGMLQGITISAASIVLIQKYRHANGELKLQLKFMTIGIAISFMLALIVTLVLPLFGITYFIPLSSLFFLTAGISIAYSIVKHHLFNIKVIATEAVVIIIWVVLFSKIFVSNSTPERIVDVTTLVIMVPFGIILIRSVIREVRIAEQQYEMVATVSHQLRTPLTPILGYAAMMAGGDFDDNPKALKDAEERLLISSQRLSNIINDFLQIFELEGSGIAGTEFIDCIELLQECIAGVQNNYDQKGLYLRFDNQTKSKPQIVGERSLLFQAISNLLDNAQCYTEEGGTVFTLAVAKGKVYITVKDTGIGLDEMDAESLFTKFYRSDAAKNVRPDGSGLGLSIVKNIFESHGGAISAQSDGRGKGTAFTLELPLKK